MAKFQVDTLSGSFVFDAADEEQARRLGQDGGRIVVKITELEEDDPNPETTDTSDESDFGDEEILIVRRSDYDRLVAYARTGGMDEHIPFEVVSPSNPVEVSEAPEHGTVAPDATTVTAPSFVPENQQEGSEESDDDSPAT